MQDRQPGDPGARAVYGCLAVLIPAAIAVALGLVVFAWNVNGIA